MLFRKLSKLILLNNSPTYYLTSRQSQPIVRNKVFYAPHLLPANPASETTVDSVSTASLCYFPSPADDEFGRCISTTARGGNNGLTSLIRFCSSANSIHSNNYSHSTRKCRSSKGIAHEHSIRLTVLVGSDAASYESDGGSDKFTKSRTTGADIRAAAKVCIWAAMTWRMVA